MTTSQTSRAQRVTLRSAGLLAGVSLLTLSPAIAQVQDARQFDQGNYYFFGDSAMGQGNWSAIADERGEDHTPYSSNNGFQRESNGLVWTEMLGRDVDIILDPDRDSSNINFAISGAHMTEGGDLQEFGVDTGVLVQTELFQNIVESGDISVGENDVFFMLAGGNDFLDRLSMDDPADEIQLDVVNAAVENVEKLVASGAKTIVLSEVQPIQFAPEFAEDAETRAIFSALMADTNATMALAVDELELPDDVNVVSLKYTDFVKYMVSNGAALGFENVDSACLTEETICSTSKEEQDRYIFIDDLHFTEAAQAIEAKWWQATLNGADGSASLVVGRAPRIIQYQIDSYQRNINPGTHLADGNRFAAYLQPIFGSSNLQGGDKIPDTKLVHEGSIFGIEGRLTNQLIIGGALSVGDVTTKFEDGSKFKLKGGGLSIYADLETTIANFSLKGTKGGHDIEGISRNTGVPLLYAGGETKGEFWGVELAGRKNYDIGAFNLTTGVVGSIGKIKVDGFSETGATGLALRYEEQSLDTKKLAFDLGVIGPAISVFADSWKLSPIADLTYSHNFGDDDYAVTSQLLDNTANIVMRRLDAATEKHLNIGVGAQLDFGTSWRAELRYEINEASDTQHDDTGSFSIRYAF